MDRDSDHPDFYFPTADLRHLQRHRAAQQALLRPAPCNFHAVWPRYRQRVYLVYQQIGVQLLSGCRLHVYLLASSQGYESCAHAR